MGGMWAKTQQAREREGEVVSKIGFWGMPPFRGRAGADGLDGSGVGEIRRFPASMHSPQRHVPFLACPMQKLPLDSLFFGRPVAVSVCGKPGKGVPVGGLGSGVGVGRCRSLSLPLWGVGPVRGALTLWGLRPLKVASLGLVPI